MANIRLFAKFFLKKVFFKGLSSPILEKTNYCQIGHQVPIGSQQYRKMLKYFYFHNFLIAKFVL